MEKPTLGFQLKGSTKRQKIVTHEAETPVQVDLIKSISDGAAVSVAPVKPKDLLVIPLIRNSNVAPTTVVLKENGNEIAAQESNITTSLEKQAEKELLAELTGSIGGNADSGLVIQQDNTNMLVRKKAPILAGSMDPALTAEMNEDDRFKLDIQSRAEDISFKSEVYDRIPISEYGAALLRGMGWEGTVDEINNSKTDQYKVVPRESRLGLGATAKPPESKYKGKNSKYDDRNSKNKEVWNKKIEEKINNQRLQVDDLVWLRDAKYAGKRGRVVQSRGVPGLDQIRVQLELPTDDSGSSSSSSSSGGSGGVIVSVSKRDTVLLSQEELASKPYRGTLANQQGEDAAQQPATQFFGLRGDIDKEKEEEQRERNYSYGETDRHNSSKRRRSRSRENDDRSHRDRDRKRREDSRDRREYNDRESRGDRAKDRDREKDYDRHHHNKDSVSRREESDHRFTSNNASSSSSGANNNKQQRSENWLRVGIRVKVVSKSVNDGRSYRAKGTVIDVPALGVCSLRLDSGSILDKVKERQLETVLPEVGGRCMVLVGEWRGQEAVLLEKILSDHSDSDARARVELCEELEQIIVSMDHIAAFA